MAWIFGLLIALAAVSAAGHTFEQLNATIYQRSGTPRLANWNELPFSGHVTTVSYDETSDHFVLLVDGSSVWTFEPSSRRFQGVVVPGVLPAGRCMLISPTSLSNLIFYCAASGTVSDCIVSNGALNCTTLQSNDLMVASRVLSVSMQFATVFNSSQRFLLIGSETGLLSYSFDSNSTHRFQLRTTHGGHSNSSNVTHVFCLPPNVPTKPDRFFGGQCFVATNENVFQYNDPTTIPMDLVHVIDGVSVKHFIRIPGVIDRRPEGAVYDAQRDAIHFANRQCVNIMYSTGELQRVEGAHGGLPQHNLTSAAASLTLNSASTTNPSVNVWFGSKFGVVLLKSNGSWKYLFGPRWLPGQGFDSGMHVSSLAVTPRHALVATDAGLSLIETLSWSLDEKNAHFQEITHRHNRFGLATRNLLKKWGNVYDYDNETGTANDGLWSSMRLSAEVFRYMSTRSAEAKENCWQVFEGMELLFKVTGIRGYPARTLQPFPPTNMKGWRASTTMPGWYWNGNTSSDEITGHLQAYPLMHDQIANTPDERRRVLRLIDDLTGTIVDHAYRLIGEGGRPTRWGFWGPKETNDDINNYDERGLNSMELLGYLSSAYRLTKNETYRQKFDDLVDKHGYGDNLVNLKISQPNDVDYSDDELTYAAYMTFYYSGQPGGALAPGEQNPCFEKVRVLFERSVHRTWNYVRRYKPAIWAAMTLYIFQGQEAQYPQLFREATEAVKWCLETYPTSMVPWPTNNENRLDVHYSIHGNRKGVHRMLLTSLLPYDEISLLLWNGNPFDKTSGGAWQEQDPSAFLYPYWVAKYCGTI